MIHIKRDDETGWGNATLYLGSKKGARYIGYFAHTGWRSYPKWMKGGWEYWQLVVQTGRLYMDVGKSRNLPTILVPAKLVSLWRMRKKSWREAMKEIPQEAQPNKLNKEGSDE